MQCEECAISNSLFFLASSQWLEKKRIDNYRQRLVGTVSADGICLVFPKRPFYRDARPGTGRVNPPPSKVGIPDDNLFEFTLGEYTTNGRQ
jgi:hypothetical protein